MLRLNITKNHSSSPQGPDAISVVDIQTERLVKMDLTRESYPFHYSNWKGNKII